MKRLKDGKRNPISEIEKAEDEGEEEEEEEEEKEPRRDEHVKRRRLTFADRLDRVEWRMTRELFKRDKKRRQDYIT